MKFKLNLLIGPDIEVKSFSLTKQSMCLSTPSPEDAKISIFRNFVFFVFL
jgi:hypothetical protein